MALSLSSEKSPSSLWLPNRTSYIMLNDLSQRKKHPYHMMVLVRSTSCSHSQRQTVARWQAVKRQKVCSGGGPSLAAWRKSMVTGRVAQMPLNCPLKNRPRGLHLFPTAN